MTFDKPINDLKHVLGDYLDRKISHGIFFVQVSGAGSVPELADLDQPEIHLDLMQETLTPLQIDGLQKLGYKKVNVDNQTYWQHQDGWRLVIVDHDSNYRVDQNALRQLLIADKAACEQYRSIFMTEGRQVADSRLMSEAYQHYADTIGFKPMHMISERMRTLSIDDKEYINWAFVGGSALDLHLNKVLRPHDDLDIEVPYAKQAALKEAFADWRMDVPIDGEYRQWDFELKKPVSQMHARHDDLIGVLMLDIMLTDFAGEKWHYRRNPSITLPINDAYRISKTGLPYLCPQAVLLFKARAESCATSKHNALRSKDELDFKQVLPTLTPNEKEWLFENISNIYPNHPWLATIHFSINSSVAT